MEIEKTTAETSLNHAGKIYLFFKRIGDIVLSLMGLVFLSPVFLIIALVMKISEPNGKVFFKQKRIGYFGNQFYIYKFRSMRVDADKYLKENQELYKKYITNGYKLEPEEDPRITKIGLFLRKTSIDELPQLLNCLIGNMSLVGPRPIVEEELDEYIKTETQYLFLQMKPGITGVWQTSGRSNVGYPERVYLEISYLEKRSILFDFKTIALTAIKVLIRDGAY